MAGSYLSLPFLILNMGGEMIYILDQRLRAQNIAPDKSQRVLLDVIRNLYAERLQEDLFRPQPLYSLTSARQFFDRLAHSSIMKLNTSSMNKLFDLMVMGVKRQALCVRYPEELLHVTAIHLETVRALIPEAPEAQLLIACAARVAQVYEPLPVQTFFEIRQELLRFFQDRHVKVSLFLQEAVQLEDGVLVISVTGEGPPGVLVPGSISKFGAGGEALSRTAVETATTRGFLPAMYADRIHVRKTTLGRNIYDHSAKPLDQPSPTQAAIAAAPVPESKPPSLPFQTSFVPPPLSSEMDEARSKVAKWEIDSLANMIRPASTADEQILRIDLFPEIMETDRSQRSEVREVEGRQKNEHLDRLRRELESVPAPTTGKTEEEDLMDLLDPS
jgi:hypothetical protein